MKYTVRWVKHAENELARIWMDAADRKLISDAAYALETELTRSPEKVGESRGGVQRIAFSGPLIVTFEVRADDAVVLILNVRLTTRRE